MSPLSPIEMLCCAIATKEGFFNPTPDLPEINNNPGDLRASPLNRFKDSHGFVKFLSEQEGIAALYQQVLRFAMMGFTVRQVITTWAPPQAADGGNNTEQYIKEVCQWTGLADSTKVWDILPCVNMYAYKLPDAPNS